MPQLNEGTALRLTSADEPTRPDADAVAIPRRTLAPLRQPAFINDLRIQGDRIAKGWQPRHAPSADQDKALDAALHGLARDLGVELVD